jgi:hypothetical protein
MNEGTSVVIWVDNGKEGADVREGDVVDDNEGDVEEEVEDDDDDDDEEEEEEEEEGEEEDKIVEVEDVDEEEDIFRDNDASFNFWEARTRILESFLMEEGERNR